MQQQKPIKYFIVTPEAYQLALSKLAKFPYDEVAGIMNEFAAGTRAMFDEPPPMPKMAGPGGQVVTNIDDTSDRKPPGQVDPGAGLDKITSRIRPGWTPSHEQSAEPGITQEYDPDGDFWWTKDPPDTLQTEKGRAES